MHLTVGLQNNCGGQSPRPSGRLTPSFLKHRHFDFLTVRIVNRTVIMVQNRYDVIAQPCLALLPASTSRVQKQLMNSMHCLAIRFALVQDAFTVYIGSHLTILHIGLLLTPFCTYFTSNHSPHPTDKLSFRSTRLSRMPPAYLLRLNCHNVMKGC